MESFSQHNLAIVEMAIEENGCNCVAGEDTFTYQRWIAQGLKVRYGQKKLTKVVSYGSQVKELDNGEVQVKRWKSNPAIFCRCSVISIDEWADDKAKTLAEKEAVKA